MERSFFLKDVKYGKGLKLRDGSFVRNYEELLSSLKAMSEYEFKIHTLTNPNFFLDWILDNYDDHVLVSKLKNSNSKSGYERILTLRINLLKGMNSKDNSSFINAVKNRPNTKVFSYIWFLVYAMLFVALFMQKGYYTSKISVLENELSSTYSLLLSLNDKSNAQTLMIRSLNEKLFDSDLALKELADKNEELFEEIKRIGLLNSPGPSHRINANAIVVKPNYVTIEAKNIILARFGKSGSMLPTITSDSLGLEVVPASVDDIHSGDIISYTYNDKVIVHRVLETGFDEDGWYAITKGDNLKVSDPEKVRFDAVQRILVGILY